MTPLEAQLAWALGASILLNALIQWRHAIYRRDHQATIAEVQRVEPPGPVSTTLRFPIEYRIDAEPMMSPEVSVIRVHFSLGEPVTEDPKPAQLSLWDHLEND